MKGYDIPREARREIAKKKAEMGDNPTEEDARQARRELMQKYRGAMEGTPREVVDELQSAKVLRAVYSERQLDEVLVDFWMNHFNVYANKGPDRFLIGGIRARGHPRPTPGGSSRTCCWPPRRARPCSSTSTTGSPPIPTRPPRARAPLRARATRRGTMRSPASQAPAGARTPRGLNENYAREIMELHTLGVDGGYTQKDVTEVARCFTGWTIRGLRARASRRSPSTRGVHDPGDKLVLGHRHPGRRQGRRRRGPPPPRHASRRPRASSP